MQEPCALGRWTGAPSSSLEDDISLHSNLKAVAALAAAVGVITVAAAQDVALPAGTLMLGEVRHVLTRELVSAGEIAPGQKSPNLSQRLQAQGFTDAQIDAGRVVILRSQIYWNNTSSGNKYSQQGPELVDEGLTVEPGNVVELEVLERGSGVVRRVRAPSLAEGGCYYSDVPVGTAVELLGALSLVGPRGSASLYCAGIEKEGWQRPRTYWHKLPGAAVASSDTPSAVSPVPVPLPAAPEPATSTKGMVTLIVTLSESPSPAFWDLPIWVDGEKVAQLYKRSCEVLVVPPGDHVVVAGAERTLFTYMPRRELKVSVTAGDRLALEYLLDQTLLKQYLGNPVPALVGGEAWEAAAFRFTQRPATAKDACALRGPARVVGDKPPPEPPK